MNVLIIATITRGRYDRKGGSFINLIWGDDLMV